MEPVFHFVFGEEMALLGNAGGDHVNAGEGELVGWGMRPITRAYRAVGG